MNCFFRKYHEALFNSTKPYQYVGGELLSHNKSFDDAKVRFAFAFPDKYEIGISNLGGRLLYEIINRHKDYMCDRVYAPETDFKPETLYGLESKRAIKEFDAIGFSLQYEMSYPTLLKMLEMAQIPYKNKDRKDDDPIIVAGGPCAYNPLPMSEFIDVFMIGDGEDNVIEICQILEKTKGLPRQERIKALVEGENSGRWSGSIGGDVKKRISQFELDTALTSYPIPFSSSVQDRAVVEIRRGCGRMCRFCQAGHVSLPIRERSAEDIIKITKDLVKNTGYDEYSLLSLSSNDYANINEVIKELAVDFNDKKISVSLPSQRIDGFNLELANLVQSVRKSTITLAAEAGSQRLRDVIKKNITEEQIIKAITTLYENGWSRVKLYFMCGLPTETLEDMDEMAELLEKIKDECKKIKREKGIKHSMDMTCTLSIFVPKPFTPFQWCGQMNLDKITEHIHYLKDKTAHIKGLKINYHEKFVSQIEAVITRGDESLCTYIEALYKKGCYLDAWCENFNKTVWQETAKECGVDLNALAEREFKLTDKLPWDFINVGFDKSWLESEYKLAFAVNENSPHVVPTCEKGCVNCGVCKNLNTHKVMAKPFKASEKAQKLSFEPILDPAHCNHPPIETFKYRIRLTKTDILKYFSHLDWQNTFFKALARTDLRVAFSQGFNPSMKVSMGVALPLFAESITEFVDIELYDKIEEKELMRKLQEVLPKQSRVLEVKQIDKSTKAIDNTVCWAEYKIEIFDEGLYEFKDLVYNTDKVLSSDEIYIEKKNKKGLIKKINIKPSIKSYRFDGNSLFIVLKTGQGISDEGVVALRADVLMNLIAPKIPFNITRVKFFDDSLEEL